MAVEDALNWLNWEQPSHLSDNSRFWVDHFQEPELADEERLDVITSLRQSLSNMQNPLEISEVMTYCGVFLYRLMRLDDAFQMLDQANKLYEDNHDVHRQAVTSWILFFVKRSLGSYSRSFEYGRRARKLMQEKTDQYALLHNRERENWYRGRVIDFTVELVSTPEDMFEWLFEFDASRFSPAAAQVRDRLRNCIERRQFPQAEQEMQILQEITRSSGACEETGEALAHCGIAEWVMEHRMNAMYFFRAALSQYLPDSHEYAVLTWVLGLVQYNFPTLRAKSFASMQSAIDKIERLRIFAVQQNQTNQRDWYMLHHNAMTRVLRQRVAGQP